MPHGREYEAAIELANVVASKSQRVVGIGKEAFYKQREMTLSAAYDYAAEIMTENMMLQQSTGGHLRVPRRKARPDVV